MLSNNLLFRRNNLLFITASGLVLFSFATLFFSRTIDQLGAPSLINFFHFFTIPLACVISLAKNQTQDRKAIASIQSLIFTIVTFFSINVLSAFINGAGLINAIINFLLLGEPFLLLLGVVCLTIPGERITQIKHWILMFALFNLGLAYFQAFILRIPNPDNIYGAFFSVAGATVSSIVSVAFAWYYLFAAKNTLLIIRVLILYLVFLQIIVSDTKLVLGSFVLGFVFFSISKIRFKTLIYVCFSIALVIFFFWALENLPILRAYAIWINPEYFTDPNSEFARAKLTAFRFIPQYYDSVLNLLFGLGPGHTIGRLGGWMMNNYDYLLNPLGSTHPYPNMAPEIMSAAFQESRNVAGTAMFGPLFSWAGIWGDLGILGLLSYLSIWLVIWTRFCANQPSKFLVTFTFALAFFPGYLEEPGSMLFTTFVIGIWWHEERNKIKTT